jgi:hypothetical protein
MSDPNQTQKEKEPKRRQTTGRASPTNTSPTNTSPTNTSPTNTNVPTNTDTSANTRSSENRTPQQEELFPCHSTSSPSKSFPEREGQGQTGAVGSQRGRKDPKREPPQIADDRERSVEKGSAESKSPSSESVGSDLPDCKKGKLNLFEWKQRVDQILFEEAGLTLAVLQENKISEWKWKKLYRNEKAEDVAQKIIQWCRRSGGEEEKKRTRQFRMLVEGPKRILHRMASAPEPILKSALRHSSSKQQKRIESVLEKKVEEMGFEK